MLISHEVPLQLLESSTNFNDYDYCLLHLTYEYADYKKFYANSTRKVLLDNSLFELGDALTNEQLAKGVLDINPTWYVVPDCLNNSIVTKQRFADFCKDYKNLPGLSIGVAQGITLNDLTDCYLFMARNADKIAIPFDSAAFDELGDEIDNLERWCLGRQRFIKYLVDKNLWCYDKPHHLLGCSYAKEFNNELYRKLNIESCDTSNPVVAGILGLRYNGTAGLREKPAVKLCDLIQAECNQNQISNIEYNVEQFRRICNGEKMGNIFQPDRI